MGTAVLVLVPVLAALELLAERAHAPARSYLLKPLTTGAVVLAALLAPAPVSGWYRALVVAGLLCSLAGDVLLMLPRNLFLPGLLSFLAAHLCYSTAFVALAGLPRSPVVAIMLAAYAWYLLARLWPRLGKYRAPVAVYTAALLFMVAAAWQQLTPVPNLRAALAIAGAVLFTISDSVLALDRFEAGFKRRQLLVLGTYFAAQWLIAASVSTAWASSPGAPPAGAAAVPPSAAVPPPAAGAQLPQAATPGPLPAPVRAACDSAATRWRTIAGARVERGDTLLGSADMLPDWAGDSLLPPPGVPTAACHVAGYRAAGLDDAAQARLYWPAAGWAELFRLTADGPDGSVRTFQQGLVRCQVHEEWDGGDDSDSTYVPDPFYRERTLCWHHARPVLPADTALPGPPPPG